MSFTPLRQLWRYSDWVGVFSTADVSDSGRYSGTFDADISAISPLAGHKYYGRFQIKSFLPGTSEARIYFGKGTTELSLTAPGTVESIWLCDNSQETKLIRGYSQTENSVIAVVYRIWLMDLTVIYGSGNEPASVAAFKLLQPELTTMLPFTRHVVGTTNA